MTKQLLLGSSTDSEGPTGNDGRILIMPLQARCLLTGALLSLRFAMSLDLRRLSIVGDIRLMSSFSVFDESRSS